MLRRICGGEERTPDSRSFRKKNYLFAPKREFFVPKKKSCKEARGFF